jgi:hypothetical protein
MLIILYVGNYHQSYSVLKPEYRAIAYSTHSLCAAYKSILVPQVPPTMGQQGAAAHCFSMKPDQFTIDRLLTPESLQA